MRFILFLIISLVPVTVYSQTVFRCDNGTVQFNSDARLELLKATSSQLKGAIDTIKKNFAFSVAASSFEGFNSPLQKEHFNENYMETDKFKNITYSGKIIEDLNYQDKESITVRTKGILNIHGVEQERIIKSKVTFLNGTIAIESNFSVFLKDHNIKIPKVVHENIASEIQVHVKATLQTKTD